MNLTNGSILDQQNLSSLWAKHQLPVRKASVLGRQNPHHATQQFSATHQCSASKTPVLGKQHVNFRRARHLVSARKTTILQNINPQQALAGEPHTRRQGCRGHLFNRAFCWHYNAWWLVRFRTTCILIQDIQGWWVWHAARSWVAFMVCSFFVVVQHVRSSMRGGRSSTRGGRPELTGRAGGSRANVHGA